MRHWLLLTFCCAFWCFFFRSSLALWKYCGNHFFIFVHFFGVSLLVQCYRQHLLWTISQVSEVVSIDCESRSSTSFLTESLNFISFYNITYRIHVFYITYTHRSHGHSFKSFSTFSTKAQAAEPMYYNVRGH